MKSCNFRVRIKNYRNGLVEYKYFKTEKEAKFWCINRSDMYINAMESYENTKDHFILYQIQYKDPFEDFIPIYYSINQDPFSA